MLCDAGRRADPSDGRLGEDECDEGALYGLEDNDIALWIDGFPKGFADVSLDT